jgi:MFS superfamily sulfate permease-like transporter
VVIGVIASALVFAWQHAKHIGADIKFNEFGSKIYQLHGPLFFASVSNFKELFDPKHDPEDVVIDFYYTRVYDQSGLEAINSLAEKYEQFGKRLHLTHLSPECRQLLTRARDLVEVNLSEDPQYHVATERILNVNPVNYQITKHLQSNDLSTTGIEDAERKSSVGIIEAVPPTEDLSMEQTKTVTTSDTTSERDTESSTLA